MINSARKNQTQDIPRKFSSLLEVSFISCYLEIGVPTMCFATVGKSE